MALLESNAHPTPNDLRKHVARMIWSYSTASGERTSYLPNTTTKGTHIKIPIPNQVLFESLEECNYGSCADTAIASAFNIAKPPFRAILKLMNIKYAENGYTSPGLTFHECKRVINLLCSSYHWSNRYVSNRKKVTYEQLIALLDIHKYLVMFDNHLSYCTKGKIYDTYLYNKCEDYKKIIPTGWWEITK